MRISKFWWWVIGVVIGLTVTYFILTRNEIKPRDEKITELTYKKDSLQNLIDSSKFIILSLEIKIDSLDSIITKKNYYIIKINKKYEDLFIRIQSLTIDEQIEWFREYISKEDSLRARYFDSDESDTTGSVQFFLR